MTGTLDVRLGAPNGPIVIEGDIANAFETAADIVKEFAPGYRLSQETIGRLYVRVENEVSFGDAHLTVSLMEHLTAESMQAQEMLLVRFFPSPQHVAIIDSTVDRVKAIASKYSVKYHIKLGGK